MFTTGCGGGGGGGDGPATGTTGKEGARDCNSCWICSGVRVATSAAKPVEGTGGGGRRLVSAEMSGTGTGTGGVTEEDEDEAVTAGGIMGAVTGAAADSGGGLS